MGVEMKYFVLNPNKLDRYGVASRTAMLSYAAAIHEENPELAVGLETWVHEIEKDMKPVKSPKEGN